MKYLGVFFISMVPLIELRGAIPIALGMDLKAIPSIIVCCVGNMLPVPVIYFFARKFLLWGMERRYIGRICHFFHDKGEKACHKLTSGRYGKSGLIMGLMLFVGIPLPGTGAWTGSLAAAFLGMRLKYAMPAVVLGVLTAGTIMLTLTHVGINLFSGAV